MLNRVAHQPVLGAGRPVETETPGFHASQRTAVVRTEVRRQYPEFTGTAGLTGAQDFAVVAQNEVNPVLLAGNKEVGGADIQQIVTLEIAVDEEHRRVHPLVTDFEPKGAGGAGVLVVLLDHLKPHHVGHQLAGLVLYKGVGQRCKRALKLWIYLG